jgi:hypothetical protein
MADLLLDLIEYLTHKGVVAGDAIDCFRDVMPDEPDKVISLYEYSGRGTTTGVGAVDRSVQIVVRSGRDDPDWARVKAWEIFNELDTPEDRVLDTREIYNGTRWAVLYARQTPFKVEVDQSGRVKYGFNMGVATHRD